MVLPPPTPSSLFPYTTLVRSSGATNATIVKAVGTGTIQNDDATAVLSIDDVVKPESRRGNICPRATCNSNMPTHASKKKQTNTMNSATANPTAPTNTTRAAIN